MRGQSTEARAERIFREHDGVLRTKEALELGIHPRTLHELRDRGIIEALSRGVYRLTSGPELEGAGPSDGRDAGPASRRASSRRSRTTS